MQPKKPHRPYIRAVRREIAPPRPKHPARRWGSRLRALLLLTVLAAGGWFAWQQFRAPEEQPLAAVRVGAVEEALEVDALIVRKEQVVAAPVAGQVRRLATEGERVRVGADVVEIGPGADPVPAANPTAQPADSAQAVSAIATSTAQREYDRLSREIYQLTAALNQATYAGETEKAAGLQGQVDDLSRLQNALVSQLQRQTARPATGQTVSKPTPDPAPVTPDPALVTPDPGATPVHTELAGIVLYQTDGLESILALADADKWSPSWLRSLPYPELTRTGEQGVAAGQPLFKIVDDLNLELIVVVPASRLTPSQRTMIAQDGLTVLLSDQDRTVNARVRRIAQEGEELLLQLTVPLPATEALRVRRMRVTLLLETFEGTVVPRTAIDVQEGVTGVWVYRGSTYQFIPVRVVGGNPQEVAVEGDLAPDDRVLQSLPVPAP